MGLLVKTVEIFKSHVTVNANFSYDKIKAYLKQVERNQVRPIIGRAMYAAYSLADPVEEIQLEVLDLLQEATSYLAMFEASKVLTMQISDSGIFTVKNTTSDPADWAKMKDMRRYLIKTGQKALDEALEIMEENQDEFPDWVASEGYTSFTELFTRHTKEFQKHFNINNSRLTFLRLRPHLLKTENKYFLSLLGAETVFQIKHGSTPEEKKALELCQAAQVPLCISEMAREGAYNLSSEGFFVTIEELPGERKIKMDQLELQNLQRTKLDDGLQQVKILVDYLRSNPSRFSLFANKETVAIKDPTHNTKSILSF